MSLHQLDDAPVAAAVAGSVAAWHQAWADTVHFVGDPFETLDDANVNDERFAMGSIYCATYRIMGGAQLDAPELLVDLDRARNRSLDQRETQHLAALDQLAAGNFSDAAALWDAMPAGDFAAARFAHDVYLHVGEVDRRVASSERAMAHFDATETRPYVASQYAFALEEAGLYDEAEAMAWSSLEADPMELWALHALAHVYESTDDQDAAIALLEGRAETWTAQDGLAIHVHWHHALRMIVAGEFERALALFDQLSPDATTPFRLSDVSSLLWRLEHAGADVGDRWSSVADALAVRPERHASGFLDLHMAIAFQRVPTHRDANDFFNGVAPAHADDPSENGEIFRSVVEPLVEAIRLVGSDPAQSAALIDSVAADTHRIGGSIAQRDLIMITRNALDPQIASTQETP